MNLLNPWVLLGLTLAFLSAIFIADQRGEQRGEAKTMTAWNKANDVATAARGKRIAANAAAIEALNGVAAEERKKDAQDKERMRVALRGALDELRKRPARPTQGGGAEVVAGAAGHGANLGCTGAGLYQDDAVLLTWKADAFQRIRMQRDACYRLYEQAQATVKKLSCQ